MVARFVIEEHRRQNADLRRIREQKAVSHHSGLPFVAQTLRRYARPDAGRVQLYRGDNRLPLSLKVTGVEGASPRPSFTATSSTEDPPVAVGSTYTLVAPAGGAVNLIETTVLEVEGRRLSFTLPRDLTRTGFRTSVRSPATRPVHLSFRNPRSGRLEKRRLHDIASNGLSFLLAIDEPPIFPGERLEVELDLLTKRLTANVIVKGFGRGPGETMTCGLEILSFEAPTQRRSWTEFCFSVAYPRVTATAHPDAALIWELLASSSYIAQWTRGEDREHLQRELLRAWSISEPETGHVVFIGGHGRATGQAAGSVVYPGTWLIHHLGMAADDRTASAVLRDAAELTTAKLQHLYDTPGIRHVMVCAAEATRWNQRVYRDFAASYRGTNATFRTFVVYRWTRPLQGTDPPTTELPDGVRRVMSRQDWTLVTRSLRERFSETECDALAYGEERIDLEDFSGYCQAHNFERKRFCFIYSDADGDAAVLVAETGSEGINVFGLLNACLITPVAGRDRPSVEATRDLLNAAISLFTREGKRSFVLFQNANDAEAPIGTGLKRISDAFRWIAHRNTIPAWRAHLSHTFSPKGAA
jgi:hypothetical protein